MQPDSNQKDDSHDVVIVPGSGIVQRFPIDRTKGVYKGVEAYPRSEPGGRKARAVVNPSDEFGPAFAIAPTRPEPAAQNGTCVLVNQHNVRIRNQWTTARLNNEPDADPINPDLPDQDPFDQPLPEGDTSDAFEILIAGPKGKVYLVQKAAGSAPSINPIPNLGTEGEIWYQLRGGFIAGSVRCFQEGRVIPMVNVTSLSRRK